MKVALTFPTISGLNDFRFQVDSSNYTVDNVSLMIMGDFTEKEVALAFNVYNAKVMEISNTY